MSDKFSAEEFCKFAAAKAIEAFLPCILAGLPPRPAMPPIVDAGGRSSFLRSVADALETYLHENKHELAQVGCAAAGVRSRRDLTLEEVCAIVEGCAAIGVHKAAEEFKGEPAGKRASRNRGLDWLLDLIGRVEGIRNPSDVAKAVGVPKSALYERLKRRRPKRGT